MKPNSDEPFLRQTGTADPAPGLVCSEVLVRVMQPTREVRPASGLNMTKRHFEVRLTSRESEPCPAVNLHEQLPLHHILSTCLQVYYLTAKEAAATQKTCKHDLRAPGESYTSGKTGDLLRAPDFIIQVQPLLQREQMKGSLTASFLA